MKFEFDPAKRKANAAKHGINFSAAQELWADAQRLELPGNCELEFRNLLVARLAGKMWIAVFTRRGENIRLISMRRARADEQELYEAQKENNREGI
jgi:uncharacterized DUF497 family protein